MAEQSEENGKGGQGAAPDRAALRAAKLRENLHKRKAQARSRSDRGDAAKSRQDKHESDT